MDKEFLATYLNGNYYSYAWLENEDEVEEWLSEYEHIYSNIEIIKIKGAEIIFEKD